MKITVFGAAGNAGSRIVQEAITRGHEVTAVVRNQKPSHKPSHEFPAGVKVAIGDASQAESIRALATQQDLLITATRPQPGKEHELLEITCTFMDTLKDSGVRLL